MRSIFRLAVAIGLVAGVSACSTANVSQELGPQRQGSSFTVRTEPGSGTFTPVLDVQKDGTGVVVTVKAQDAANVSAAYVHVAFDSSSYTPADVQVGNFLGSKDQVVSIALTDRSGDVPVGVAQITCTGVQPKNGAGVLATIHFRNGASNVRSVSSKSPLGASNKVVDLIVTGQTGSSADLQWTEKNSGDYDNNGEVGISDLTPVGLFFGQTVALATDPVHAGMVDGDGNGEINIADITPIGSNLGHSLSGYILYTDANAANAVTTGITVLRSDQDVQTTKPVVYHYTAGFTPGSSPTFVVRPAADTDLSNPGPISNGAGIISDPGNPLRPTNLTVDSSAIVGTGKLKLTWTLSTSTDVVQYEVDRKLTSDDDTHWASISDSNPPTGQTNTFTDSGLDAVSYDYRVWSIDNTALKSNLPSDTATGTPFVLVVAPPINVTATSGGGAHSITVAFDRPADNTAFNYAIYRDGTALAGATGTFVVGGGHKEYVDSDMAAGDSHDYYVIGLDASSTIQSVPSQTATALGSADAQPIHIVDLTTDKTTHYQGGTEPAANLTVTTDSAPDTITWTATAGGDPSGGPAGPTGGTAVWKPTGNPAAGTITITCKVHNAAGDDTKTIDMHVTSKQIITTYSIQGIDSGNLCDGTGHFYDFTRPSNMNAAGEAMSKYLDGKHVVTYNLWEMWCPPCKAEMPEMYTWATTYGPSGKYYHVGHASTYGLTDDGALGYNLMTWLATAGYGPDPQPSPDTRPWNSPYWIIFNQSVAGTGQQWAGDLPLWQHYWQNYGIQGSSVPRTILFDMDGNARVIAVQGMSGPEATNYENTIKELAGL